MNKEEHMFMEQIVPFHPKPITMLELMDHLFYSWPKSDPKPPATWRSLKNDDDELSGVEIQVALAGFKEDDLKVYADGRQLVVRGDNINREDVDPKWKTEFSKKFSLQECLDLESAAVKFFDGLLSIKIPLKKNMNKTIPLFGK